MAQRPRMRPEFAIPIADAGPAIMAQLQKQLACKPCPVGGQVRGQHAFLSLPDERQSLLSPHLNLELDLKGGNNRLKGRFSPRPNVWTGFMALYGFLALCGLAGVMYGWAQTTVDEFPWGFFALPAAAALIAFAYGAAVIGQGLTADEMYELRAFVDRALDKVLGPEWRACS